MRRIIWERIEGFLFPQESDTWLTVLRLGAALQVILYCSTTRAEWHETFSMQSVGPIRRDLSEAVLSAQSHFIPRMGWLVDAGARIGLGEGLVLEIIWWALLIAGISLLVGLFCRASAIVAAFLHLCAVKSSGALSYGVDIFTIVGLFYVAVAPLPDSFSLDRHFRQLKPKYAELNGFFRRALQVHVCLIYFFSGIAKCAGVGWWNGESIWRAVIRPPFNMISPSILIHWKFFFPIASISVCILETAYPIFIWPRRTRVIWLCSVVAMHIGIAAFLGMYLFALIMIILNLAAFGPPFRWRQDAGVNVVAEQGIA
ncbi:MAG TPA: HTTM domain-containing protein [Chthoniobacterales bacterium]|nr:HTTM domain-containing protein [Chthoniobacterales bacterium]